MSRRSTYPLADKAFGGKLSDFLESRRAAGDSFETIARELHAQGIPVSGETVRRWLLELGQDVA